MDIATTQQADSVVLTLHGACTGETDAAALATALKAAKKAAPPCIWLNCQHLTHIDYRAMRLLLQQLTQLETAGIALRLCGLQPAVYERFENTGFASLLALEPVGAYKRPAPR